MKQFYEHGVGDDLWSALGRGQKLHVPSEDGHDDLGDETEYRVSVIARFVARDTWLNGVDA